MMDVLVATACVKLQRRIDEVMDGRRHAQLIADARDRARYPIKLKAAAGFEIHLHR